MAYISVVFFGILAVRKLPVTMLPPVPNTGLIVFSEYSGYPPDEVRECCTIPLENAFSSLQGLKKIHSATVRGKTVINLLFHWGTDMELAEVGTRQVIDNTMGTLPAGIQKPVVVPAATGTDPLIRIGIIPENGDCLAVKQLADRHLKNRFQRLNGVSSVSVVGGTDRVIEIAVDYEKALRYGLTFSGIHQFLAESNISYPAGKITVSGRDCIVKTDGRITSLEELKKLRLPLPAGENEYSPLPLSELADIRIAEADRNSTFFVNGKEGCGLFIYGRPGFSPVTLSRDVREEIRRTNNATGDITLSMLTDRSVRISESIQRLIISAAAGGAIVFIVILLFLRDASAGLVLFLIFPWSLCFCFILLYLFSRSINLMSLGGIVIGTGMLVDNGIVVLARIRQSEKTVSLVTETAPALLSSTATTVIVFLPLLFLPGAIGSLYTGLALSVIFLLTASFFSAVFLAPSLYTSFQTLLRKRTPQLAAYSVETVYGRLFRFFYENPRRFMPLLLLPLLTGTCGAVYVPVKLFSQFRSEYQYFTVQLPPGLTMGETRRLARSVTGQLSKRGRYHFVSAYCGAEPDDIVRRTDLEQLPENLHFVVDGKKADPGSVRGSLKQLITEKFPSGFSIIHRPRGPDLPLLQGPGNELTVINIAGKCPEEARSRAEDLERTVLAPVFGPETERITARSEPMREYLYFYPKRELLTKTGISLAGAAGELSTCLSGSFPTVLTIGEQDYPIRLNGRGDKWESREALPAFPFSLPGKSPAAAGNIFRISVEQLQRRLYRQDKNDIVRVTLVKSSTIPRKKMKRLAAALRSKDYAEFSSASIFRENWVQIAVSFGAALLLIYFVLGAHFESFIHPLLIFVPLPVAVMGMLTGLLISGKALDTYAALGGLVLLGLSVNNSIFLSAAYKQKLSDGLLLHCSIYSGSMDRIRPILLTTMTTIAALLPLSIDPGQSAAQSGMAAAIIGGLGFSALFTVTVQPCIYSMFFSRRGASCGKQTPLA